MVLGFLSPRRHGEHRECTKTSLENFRASRSDNPTKVPKLVTVIIGQPDQLLADASLSATCHFAVRGYKSAIGNLKSIFPHSPSPRYALCFQRSSGEMKRCPKCDSVCADSDLFCDLDGTPLVEDLPAPSSDPKPENWKALVIGVVAGLGIGLVLFTVYYGLSRRKEPATAPASGNASASPERRPMLHVTTASNATPSPDSSPSPSPSPSSTPSPQPSATVRLSSNPISTAAASQTDHATITIQLKNGSSIQADEAWEGAEGIWYRWHGVVSLLDRAQVKAIERPTPSPSPSPSSQ